MEAGALFPFSSSDRSWVQTGVWPVGQELLWVPVPNTQMNQQMLENNHIVQTVKAEKHT